MDSFNVYKGGYGKIDHLEAQQLPSSHLNGRRRSILIAVSSLLLLTLILISLFGGLVHESGDGDSDDDGPVDPIRYACNFTQHKDACFASISAIDSRPKPDPLLILSILLRSTMNELGNHLALPKRLTSKVKDDRRTISALEDCGTLLNDAFRSLNQSAEKLSAAMGEGLTEMERGDLRTWISAAMTDQETCVDGLEEMGSSVAEEVKKAVQGATVGMSNTLAILAYMDALKMEMGKFCHQPKH